MPLLRHFATSPLRHFATSPLRHFATSPLRHFATSPLRHASRLVTLVVLALAGTAANATLIVNVEGVRGSGKTTWTLSGSDKTTQAGTIRSGTKSNTFSSDDTIEASDKGRFLSDKTMQNRLFALKGSAKITIGGVTRNIAHIFLDSDDGGPDGDDFGIRTKSKLDYKASTAFSWSGRFTLDLDISKFNLGSYTDSLGGNFYAANASGTVRLNFKETSVPEPSSLALLGLALTSLGFSRKRKSAQPKALNSAD